MLALATDSVFNGPLLANETTQPAITCSKLTMETLEQGVKYVQANGLGTDF